MTSNLKFKSNRRNARKSTGPKTEVGKKKSAVNAISHGLSARPIFDAETQEKIKNLAASFVDRDTNNPQVMALAQKAAEAQFMVERVKDARRLVWVEASSDRTIAESGPEQIFPCTPNPPFEYDIERDAAILKAASRKLDKLVRFERRTANQRDKALRLLAHIEKLAYEY